MKVSFPIKPVNGSEREKFIANRALLQPGDKLMGRVIELKDSGNVLIDFGKFRAIAEVHFPVALGETLDVIVIESGKQLRLKAENPEIKNHPEARGIAGNTEFLSEELLQRLPLQLKNSIDAYLNLPAGKTLPPNIVNGLANVLLYFEPFTVSDTLVKLAAQLKVYIENSGVFFEKNMEAAIIHLLEDSQPDALRRPAEHPILKQIMTKDLKANLGILRDYFTSKEGIVKIGDTKSRARIPNIVKNLLTNIENQQSNALVKHNQPEPMQVFHFTLPFEEKIQKARLKFYYPKKKKEKSKEEFRLSLLLGMERIGEIRTDMVLLSKTLKIFFFVTDENIKNILEKNYPKIKGPLSSLFEHLIVSASVSKKKIEEFDNEDSSISGNRFVDIMV